MKIQRWIVNQKEESKLEKVQLFDAKYVYLDFIDHLYILQSFWLSSAFWSDKSAGTICAGGDRSGWRYNKVQGNNHELLLKNLAYGPQMHVGHGDIQQQIMLLLLVMLRLGCRQLMLRWLVLMMMVWWLEMNLLLW